MRNQYHTTADLFRRTDFMLRRCIEKKLRTMDEEIYRSQHRLLMHLGRNPDCSQNELAAMLEISPAAVAVSLNKLEKGGYIARKTNSDDHRSNRVTVTEKGNQIIHDSIRFFDEIDRGMFEGFTQEEMGQFHELLERAYRNLGGMQGGTVLWEADQERTVSDRAVVALRVMGHGDAEVKNAIMEAYGLSESEAEEYL